MTDFAFSSVPYPVRRDIGVAHERAWQRLARPGSWWSGAERVAIAAEVRAARDCALCRERKAALSPYSVDGDHDTASDVLPEVAVDAVHRITTDAARLTKSWFEKSLAAGLSTGQYVEIVGTVVTVVSVDAFCSSLGFDLHPLPEPQPGEPDRYTPPGLEDGGAWVPMLHENRAKGREADLYGTPRTGNVIKAMSLVPEEVRGLSRLSAAHYLPMRVLASMRSNRAISRPQIELIAARVSALNECFY